MRVSIFHVSSRNTGGDAELAAHAFASLKAERIAVNLYTLEKLSGGRGKEFVSGVTMTPVTPKEAERLAARPEHHVLVTGADETTDCEALALILEAAPMGGLALQRPPPEDLAKTISDIRPTILLTNPSPLEALERWREMRTLRLPFYIRRYPPRPRVRHHALCLNSLDDRAGIRDVIRINSQLPAARRVMLYGGESAPGIMEALDEETPSWSGCYKGPIQPHHAASLTHAKGADYLVDLRHEGGRRISYPWLYAWEAGIPVIAYTWSIEGEPWPGLEVTPEDIITAESFEQARELVRSPKGTLFSMKRRNAETLRQHGPRFFASSLYEALKP